MSNRPPTPARVTPTVKEGTAMPASEHVTVHITARTTGPLADGQHRLEEMMREEHSRWVSFADRLAHQCVCRETRRTVQVSTIKYRARKRRR